MMTRNSSPQNKIEDRWDREWLVETDKAWDAIHRCLTDGTLRVGRSPLHNCILGSESLHEGDGYIVNFLEPDEVKEVAEAIKDIDRGQMRGRYDAIDRICRVTANCRMRIFEYT